MEWRTLWEGPSDDAPNLHLEGGRLYRITLQNPGIPTPDWLSGAIFKALSAIGVDVRGVAPGESEIVVTFWI